MRLATFNIWNGRSPGVHRVDLDRLANAIRTLAPDISALQEVDQYQPRSLDAELAAIAAEAMECVDHRFVAALAGSPGGRWVPAGDRDTDRRAHIRERPILPLPGPQLGSAADAGGWPARDPPFSRPPARCRYRRGT